MEPRAPKMMIGMSHVPKPRPILRIAAPAMVGRQNLFQEQGSGSRERKRACGRNAKVFQKRR